MSCVMRGSSRWTGNLAMDELVNSRGIIEDETEDIDIAYGRDEL